MNEAKSIFKSRTFWFNAAGLLMLGAQLALGHHWIAPADQGFVVGVGNIILRIVTTQPVTVP